MEYAPIILDVVLAVVILISAIKAYAEGFFASGVNLIGNIGGLLIAWFASNKFSIVVFDTFFKNKLIDKTFEYIQNSANALDVKGMIDGFVGGLPSKFMQNFIDSAQSTAQELTEPTRETAIALVDTFIGPIITIVIGVVIFIAIMLICKVITSVLARLLQTVNAIPVLGFANRLAGFLMGLLIGCVNIILISCLLSIIAIVTNNSIGFLNMEILSQSKILELTSVINPFLR